MSKVQATESKGCAMLGASFPVASQLGYTESQAVQEVLLLVRKFNAMFDPLRIVEAKARFEEAQWWFNKCEYTRIQMHGVCCSCRFCKRLKKLDDQLEAAKKRTYERLNTRG